MKQDQNLRFVIIGMGYLMEYIAPCYSKLLGDKKAEQMLGVTAEPQAVQSKAKATGIPVILNDNAGALRRMEPDIILFAPPPSLAAPLTESVLVPYFAARPAGSCRCCSPSRRSRRANTIRSSWGTTARS